MARFEVPEGWTAQAYRFALDPCPAQERAFRSHAGAARKAHNTMLGLVTAVMGQRAAERSYGIAEADLTPARDCPAARRGCLMNQSTLTLAQQKATVWAPLTGRRGGADDDWQATFSPGKGRSA